MKKLLVIMVMLLGVFQSYSQQLGVVNVSPKETEIPVDFWYVIDGKDFVNQMFYYNTTEKTKELLKNMLAGYGQSSETPFGTDKEGDNYWIITHPSGNIVYLYYSLDEDGYSMIISVTK